MLHNNRWLNVEILAQKQQGPRLSLLLKFHLCLLYLYQLPHLLEHRATVIQASLCHRDHPPVSHPLGRLSLAFDGHAGAGSATIDDRDAAVLWPGPQGLGRYHGFLLNDHHPGADRLLTLPEMVCAERGFHRYQGIKVTDQVPGTLATPSFTSPRHLGLWPTETRFNSASDVIDQTGFLVYT